MLKPLRIHDTCGNFNLHALPAIIAALTGFVFAASSVFENYKLE